MRTHHAKTFLVLLGLAVSAVVVEALHAQSASVVTDIDATNVDAYIKEQSRLIRKAYLDVGAKYLASMGCLGNSLGGMDDGSAGTHATDPH